MKKIREFSFPALVIGGWLFASAYVVAEFAAPKPLPVIYAPEMEIIVEAPANPS